MKNMIRLLKVCLFLGILLAVTFPVLAEAERTEFTGTAATVGLIDPGVETFPDGNDHMRGLTVLGYDEMSDPRLTGYETTVINYNLRPAPPPAFITGPMWGTSLLENEGGYWEITWTGVRDEQGFAYLQAIGHGRGGYEGLLARYELVRLSPDPNAPYTVTGTILDTNP